MFCLDPRVLPFGQTEQAAAACLRPAGRHESDLLHARMPQALSSFNQTATTRSGTAVLPGGGAALRRYTASSLHSVI